MRVLLGHNYYRSSAPSGEDAVFRNERALLENNGHHVIPFERFNDDIDDSTVDKRVRLAMATAWSKSTHAQLVQILRRSRPDVAHFHNTFPLISPSAYAACHDNAVPVVQTLHNYRLVCAGALLTRDGKPCEDCLAGDLMPAIWHRCYRGSLAATGAVVWMLATNRRRGVYQRLVNRYIALTDFAARKVVAGGLPKHRVEVKPNFLPHAPSVGRGDGKYAVYVGRLSEEKGVRTLIDAWKRVHSFPLKILGDGAMRAALEQQVQESSAPVEFLGFRPRDEVLRVMGAAQVLIVPSECYEGFPMVVAEAYACGTPVLASRIGSLDEIVEDGETGAKFEAGNPDDLARQLGALTADPERLRAMRAKSRAVFEDKYTAERNFARLIEIYDHARTDFVECRDRT